jgi:hypothetical protein
MHFLKKQDYIKKIFFYVFMFLTINTNIISASPSEEDLKKISIEIYNLVLQAKSTFENGDIMGSCNIAFSIIDKWENLNPDLIEQELIDKYYLIDGLVKQNKEKISEICQIE